ncbi:hypothetical protein MaudCBS49596_006003 [Microsporum audouinii]
MAEKPDFDNDKYGEKYRRVYYIIDSAEISAFENQALTNFITSTSAAVVTSKYVQDRVSQNSGTCTLEETLRSLLQDISTLSKKMTHDDDMNPKTETALYERDGGRCFISGLSAGVKPTHIVAPSIQNDKDLLPGGYLRPLLEAMFRQEEIEQMFALLHAQEKGAELKNLLLMEPSVRWAFLGGHFQIIKQSCLEPPESKDPTKMRTGGWWLRRTPPGRVYAPGLPKNNKLYAIPSTPNPDTHPLPAAVLLSIHQVISRSLRNLAVEKVVEAGWPAAKPEPYTLGRIGRMFLRATLNLLPGFIRLRLFEFIDKLAGYWDPTQKNEYVKYLPLGLCLKRAHRNIENEANALLLVEKYTSINAPRLIGSATVDHFTGYILMTRIFGDPLSHVHYLTTWEERKQIGKDLAKWIAEMRRIPNKSKFLIADTLGGPISDHRFSEELWGPFNKVSDFTDRLTRDVFSKKPRHETPLSYLYERKHDVCFTHSDLHISNLYVTRGRLTGIVDWENAGFKPEYWEFTRSLWTCAGSYSRKYMYMSAFDGKYDDEYKAEMFILENSPFIF